MYTSNVVVMGVTGEVVLPFENVPSTAFSRGKAYEQVVETVETLTDNETQKFSENQIFYFKQTANSTKIVYFPEQNPQ